VRSAAGKGGEEGPWSNGNKTGRKRRKKKEMKKKKGKEKKEKKGLTITDSSFRICAPLSEDVFFEVVLPNRTR